MRRREFIAFVGGAAAWPLPVRAQRAVVPVIGLLSSISADGHPLPAFHRGLAEQGYVENRNVAVEYRFAEGGYDRLPALASELVSRPVDVIAAVGSSPAALAAKSATQRNPIVFFLGVDVVELGLVASYNRPGGNVTGVSITVASLLPKRLEMLDKVLAKSAPIGVLVNPNNRFSDGESKLAREAAGALGRGLILVGAATAGEIETAFNTLIVQKAGGLAVSQEAFLESHRNQIVALALHHRLPLVGPIRAFTEAGALMSYGSDIGEAYRQVGIYVGRILKGAKPADLPVMQPDRFEFVINLQTARTIGIEIPPTMLALTDAVIE